MHDFLKSQFFWEVKFSSLQIFFNDCLCQNEALEMRNRMLQTRAQYLHSQESYALSKYGAQKYAAKTVFWPQVSNWGSNRNGSPVKLNHLGVPTNPPQ